MDEVGRGTTSEDGIAVAFACLHHLYHINQSRTLFATHFHALADMTRDLPQLECYCTDIAEDASGSFNFDHRLRKGINRQSHALKVARLAGRFPCLRYFYLNVKIDYFFLGLPEAALQVAMGLLSGRNNMQN